MTKVEGVKWWRGGRGQGHRREGVVCVRGIVNRRVGKTKTCFIKQKVTLVVLYLNRIYLSVYPLRRHGPRLSPVTVDSISYQKKKKKKKKQPMSQSRSDFTSPR